MIQFDKAKQERTMASGKRARKSDNLGVGYGNYWSIVCRISSSTPKSSSTFNALQSFKLIMIIIQFVFMSPFESGERRSMLASAIQTGQALNSTGTCTAFYLAVGGETCASLVASQKLTQVQIFELNPGLHCNGLIENQAICVKGMSTRCAHRISVNAGQSNFPTCASIVAANDITSDTFKVLNPGLSCPEASGNNNAWPSNSTAVCVSPGLGKIFFEYIGAYNSSVVNRSSYELTGKPVAFTDLQPLVQTYPTVAYYFILAFAIDFDGSRGVSENNNGTFYPYWNPQLTPAAIQAFKTENPGVQVLMSLGGDSVWYPKVRSITWIDPKNVTEWVDAAEASIVAIVEEYSIDGLDIYYRDFDFRRSPLNFSFCMGELITRLKRNNTIGLATISPAQLDAYNNDPNGSVIQYYQALMSSYGDLIDYVNFQTDALDNGSYNWQTPAECVQQFDSLTILFDPWKLTASSTFKNGFSSANPPEFVDCLHQIQDARGLPGVMIFEADDTVSLNFTYEKGALAFLSGLLNSEIVLVASPVSSSRRILPSTWCAVGTAVCCFWFNLARWPLTQKGW